MKGRKRSVPNLKYFFLKRQRFGFFVFDADSFDRNGLSRKQNSRRKKEQTKDTCQESRNYTSAFGALLRCETNFLSSCFDGRADRRMKAAAVRKSKKTGAVIKKSAGVPENPVNFAWAGVVVLCMQTKRK